MGCEKSLMSYIWQVLRYWFPNCTKAEFALSRWRLISKSTNPGGLFFWCSCLFRIFTSQLKISINHYRSITRNDTVETWNWDEGFSNCWIVRIPDPTSFFSAQFNVKGHHGWNPMLQFASTTLLSFWLHPTILMFFGSGRCDSLWLRKFDEIWIPLKFIAMHSCHMPRIYPIGLIASTTNSIQIAIYCL